MVRSAHFLPAVAAFVLACAGAAPPESETPPPAPIPDPAPRVEGGFYSPDQAARGRESFLESCEECHSISEFRGRDFEWTWRRRTAWALFNEISFNMPEDAPASLAPETYADIVAYLLQLNDYAAGATELRATRESLEAVPLGPGAEKSRTRP